MLPFGARTFREFLQANFGELRLGEGRRSLSAHSRKLIIARVRGAELLSVALFLERETS